MWGKRLLCTLPVPQGLQAPGSVSPGALRGIWCRGRGAARDRLGEMLSNCEGTGRAAGATRLSAGSPGMEQSLAEAKRAALARLGFFYLQRQREHLDRLLYK